MKRKILILGGTGDLARKKLYPALSNLYQKNKFKKLITTGRRYDSESEFFEKININKNLKEITKYLKLDLLNFESNLEEIKKEIGNKDQELIVYLALSPEIYYDAIDFVYQIKNNFRKVKIAIEKPIGYDLESSHKLNDYLLERFKERNIFRIDHYLGKEFVQNIISLRFYNDIIQGVWNNKYLDNIQIVVDEDFGIEDRISLYSKLGAIKDVFQNHILQVLTLLTMNEPNEINSDELSYEKLKILKSLTIDDAIFGTYKSLRNQKEKFHTLFATKLYINNFNLSGVPIYIRTGKNLKQKSSKVYVEFKKQKEYKSLQIINNALEIEIQPEMNINFIMNVKNPKKDWKTNKALLNYNHEKTSGFNTVDAYEKIINKVIDEDKILFPKIDEIYESWKIVDNILNDYEDYNHFIYEKGKLPKELHKFIEKDSKKWKI